MVQDNTCNGMTVADSGYHPDQGTVAEQGVEDDDNASVATDGESSMLPREHKRVLEAEFARELYNRAKPALQKRLCEDVHTVSDLLYAFSRIIGKRASSATERSAASFVRHGRMQVFLLHVSRTAVFTFAWDVLNPTQISTAYVLSLIADRN
jgi:hypothetical protein